MNSAEQGLRRRRCLRWAAAAAGCWVAGRSALAAAPVARASIDPLTRSAVLTPRALGAALMGVALAGTRLVAVGERGIILLSDDVGLQWRQVACPVSVTLTAVCFATPMLGWAVGHGGAVLHTADGGASWSLQFDGRRAAQLELDAARAAADQAAIGRAQARVAEGADKPLLDVRFEADGRRGIAVGAYGLALMTDDGGRQWRSLGPRLDNPRGYHLYAIHVVGQSVWLAGEQGLLLRSTDGGTNWSRLRSPYEGSWFAITGLQEDLVVLGGLRGNVWCTSDRGASFTRSQVPVPISIASATVTDGGELLLINQAGMLLASSDHGHAFRPVPVPPGPPATDAVPVAEGVLVVTTLAGPMRWPRSPAAPAASR